MAEIKSDSQKAIATGFLLGLVNDIMPKGKYNLLQNVRIYKNGEIASRPMLGISYGFNPDPNDVPHTLKTIIYQVGPTNLRFAGIGTKIYSGNIPTLFQKDTGYSGNPLSLIDFRPEQSIETYLYIGDKNKLKKISANDVLKDWGITVPQKAAVWKIGAPNRKIVDKIDTGSAAQWNNLTGSAGVPTDELRVNTTITKYLADGALPNYASIVPVALTSELQKDSIVTLNGAQDVIVEEVIPAALNTGIATITKIVYDAGVSGMATIVLSVSSADLRRNSIVLLNGTEYVRVQEVTRDSNGIPSIRVSTVGTFVNGNTISGVASFRFYATVAYVAGNTIISRSIKSVIGASGISTLTRTFNVDLQNTGTTGKPLTDNDIFHISLLLSTLNPLVEIKVQLNVDSTIDFLKNYYEYTISPNFFLGTSTTISAIQQSIARQNLLATLLRRDPEGKIYDIENIIPVDPIVNQTTLGDSQWTEANIRLGDFLKKGSDNSKTLKDVNAIRVSINVTAGVDLFIDSFWVGGADVLESNIAEFLPYNYVWRIRDSTTRVPSNWSPPLREGVRISRGRVELSFPDANANYPATYKVDIARFGGSLNDFRIVGSILNDGSSYIDTSSDRIVADNDPAGRYEGQGSEDSVFDFYKPFAILDTPKKGTCDVVGTKFTWISGDKLNITYPRGTQILVNGIANRLYTNPISTGTADAATVAELERDMGSLTGVAFELQDPLLTGQPLPIIFGPFGQGNFGLYIFGLGDEKAAGTLYWCDGNSPDTQSDLNRLEITSPSEPLVSGVMYDGFPFVWTTKKSFMIIPSVGADGSFGFIARENANARGLFSKWAIGVGKDFIFHLSENADGIYRVQGNGNPQLITEGFNNLFYVDGKIPSPVTLIDGTIIYPPNFTLLSDLRIFCVNDYMHFRFVDADPAGGKQVLLTYDIKLGDWISYDTFPNNQINAIYKVELENNTFVEAGVYNSVKIFGGVAGFENATRSKIIPFSFDGGDSRFIKEFKEENISIDEGVSGFNVRNYYDNGDTNDPVQVIAGSVGHKRKQFIINLEDSVGSGVLAKNITSVFDWLITSGTKLYEEIFYFIPQGNIIDNLGSDLENAGSIGSKLWQGVVIQADTFGIDKELNYYDDQNILRATLVINHNGKKTISYGFDQPFISHTIRRLSTDNINWLPLIEEYVTDVEPEAAKVWEGEFNTSDLVGLITMKRIGIAYRSNADATITFFHEDNISHNYTIPNSNGDFTKFFFYVQAKKWLACKYRIESAEDIRIYRRATEIYLKSFTGQQPFNRFQTFGGRSNESDIQI